MSQTAGRGSIATVFFVILMDLIGFGIVLPLLPFYAQRFEVNALQIGLLYSIYSLGQLVFSPLWGSWSDRVGRRPVMLLSTLGSTLSYLVFVFSNSFALLLFSRLLAGVMGGNISAAQAYVADVTPSDSRTKAMGLIGAAFGIGFMIGPALAALFLHFGSVHALPEQVFVYPGIAAACLSGISFLMVIFLLPESLNQKKLHSERAGSRIERLPIYTPPFWTSLWKESKESRKHILPFLFLGAFMFSFAQSSMYGAYPLYCKETLGMDAKAIGIQFAIMGMAAVLVQGGLLRVLLKKQAESRIFLFGALSAPIGYLMLPWGHSAGWLVGSLCVMAIGFGLSVPIITSLVSQEVHPNEVGRALGNIQAISSLGRVLGPAYAGLIFAWHPRLPFILTAFLLLLIMVPSALKISAKTTQT